MKTSCALIAVLLLSGCTTEQAYNTAQGWQRNQCGHLPDKADFDRCMRDASRAHEEYRRQAEAEKK